MNKERILIAEDRLLLSARLADIVGRAGYQPVLTQSGQVAVSRARVLRPSLVLLSEAISNPGPSETSRRLKEDPDTHNIPIVLMAESAGGARLAHAYPVEACLPVDINAGHLAHIVRFLLGEYAKHAVRSSLEVWPLEGTLDDGMLQDVLQFLFLSGRSGRIVVSNGAQKGSLYFERDSVQHAELDGIGGEEGFFKICFLEAGHFRFEPDAKAPEVTLNGQGRELLLEACRRLDTLRHDSEAAARTVEFSDWKPAWRPRAVPVQDFERLVVSEPAGFRAPVPEPLPLPTTTPRPPPLPPMKDEPPPRLPLFVEYGATVVFIALGFLALGWIRSGAPEAKKFISAGFGEAFPITILSMPEGARVRIDGKNVGETPLRDFRLGAGRYLLQLEKDGLDPIQQLIRIGADAAFDTLSFTLKPSGPVPSTLVLVVLPDGAEAYVSGRAVDHRQAISLEPGEHDVKVRAPGFDEWSETVELPPGESREMVVRLKRRIAQPAPAEVAVVLPQMPVEPPVKISGSDATYPVEADRNKVQGTVELTLEVDVQGNVASARVEQSAGALLDGAVLAAVKTFKYKPATQAGVPVNHAMTYRQTFRSR